MSIIKQDYGEIGGGTNNKYQIFATHNGGNYAIVYQGNIVKFSYSGDPNNGYDDDNISWTNMDYAAGTWKITVKNNCMYSQNNATPTAMSANTVTSCVYTGGIYEFDFN